MLTGRIISRVDVEHVVEGRRRVSETGTVDGELVLQEYASGRCDGARAKSRRGRHVQRVRRVQCSCPG